MKHVKKFENSASESLKSYIIYDYNEECVILYQVISNGEKLKKCMILYYDNDEIVDTRKDSISFYFWCDKFFLDNVLYQSDNLDDTIEKMYVIKKSKKYNI